MSKRIQLSTLFMLFAMQLCPAGVFAADKILDASQLMQSPISVTEYFSVLEDPGATLTIADVQTPEVSKRFQSDQKPADSLSYGFTRSAYWLRLIVRNSSKLAIERMLEISEARLSSVQFYQPTENHTYDVIKTGMVLPFASRPYYNRFFVFPIALAANSEQTYYIRTQSRPTTIIPVKLWAVPAFHVHERDDYLFQAWYFGIATAMIVFNLLLFVSLKDVIYLLYVINCSLIALCISSINGFFKEFVLPDSLFLSDNAPSIFINLSFIALLIFTRRMLNTKVATPIHDWLIKIDICMVSGILILERVAGLQIANKFGPFVSVFCVLVILSASILCVLKRQRSAYFFFAAFFVFLGGALSTTLRSFAILPTNLFTINGLQIGSVLEMLLLAFALADRFIIIRKEKENAQEALVENLRESERVLEARVKERTLELQTANKKLEVLSITDGLTGIANRRHFDEVLAIEWARAQRQNQPLALAMMDVDWFKKYNDHYGHQTGDDCLKNVAKVLMESICRPGDLVARYGGEEFVFIALAADGETALKMARKISTALQALALPHELSDFGCVTVSIGVASILPSKNLESDFLIKAADDALYQAKKQGRNRAIIASL